MGVPLRYNLRSLYERKGTTLMTAIGIALTVAVLVISLSLMAGLRATFSAAGNPQQAIILRKGLTSELASDLQQATFNEIRAMPQLARTPEGDAMASSEVVSVINLPSVDSPAGMNVTVRGLLPIGAEMRGSRLRSGSMFRPGHREVIVGEGIARRYPAARVGNTIRFGRGQWTVVGVFSGATDSSAIGSEIWGDLNQVRADLDRQGGMSSVLVRLSEAALVPSFARQIDDNRRLGASAMSEMDYYAQMTSSGTPLETLGFMIATIMAIGSGFGAMNTMYAAVSRRSREIGTLRALGFSRMAILKSFMFESMLLSLMGGILGCLLALPVNNVTTGVGNFSTFSEVAFRFKVGPQTLLVGLAFSVVIGTLGGFLPARAAARRDLVSTLREY